MREDRLLERIRKSEKNPERRAKEDSRKLVDSVLDHLQKILNTKKGNVPIAEDYGIPDFTDLIRASPETLKDVEKGIIPETFKDFERSIKNMIQKYEPRLKSVRLTFTPQEEDPISLHFNISARLIMYNKNVPIIFEAVYSDGKIEIKG